MKTNTSITLATALLGFTLTQTHASVVILDDRINGGLDSSADVAEQNGTQWSEQIGGGWSYGAGNTWIYSNGTMEGGLVRSLDLSGLGLGSQKQLDVSFTYGAWGASGASGEDDLYVHAWALKDLSSTGSSAVADLTTNNVADGGIFADQTGFSKFSYTNLKDGSTLSAYNETVAITAAFNIQNVKLSDTNNGTQATANFTLNSPEDFSNYDYLVIGFARDVSVGTSEQFALKDMTVTAVPEPSSVALLALGGAAISLRRRRQ